MIILLSAGIVSADGIDDVIKAVLENNPELAESELTLEEYLETRPELIKLKDSSLILNGSYSFNLENSGSPEPGGSIGISVPVIAPLSLSTSYSYSQSSSAGQNNDSLSIGLTYKPFTDPDDIKSWTDQEYILYLQNARQIENIRTRTEIFYISWIIAKGSSETALMKFEQAGSNLENAKYKYEVGLISYETYQKSVIAYTDQSIELTTARRNLLDKRQDALDLIGNIRALDNMDSWEISFDELRNRIISSSKTGAIPLSADLVRIRAELESLKREQKRTWIWEPDLTLSLNTAVPLESISVNGKLTFSYNQIMAKEKEILAGRIRNKELELELEKEKFKLQAEIYGLAVETAEENLSILKLSMELAEQNMEAAESGIELGVISGNDLLTAEINLKQAELDLLKGAADMLQALRNRELLYIEAALP